MAINTVGELIDALERYPVENYVSLLIHQEDGDKIATEIHTMDEVEGVVYLVDEPLDSPFQP